MKIIGARVSDPRSEGKYENPVLHVLIDGVVTETGKPALLGKTRVVPCGPFLAVEVFDRGEWSDIADLASFNTNTNHREQLVNITVESSLPEEVDSSWDLQMGVRRAQRLVRKYAPLWTIRVDQEAALRGRLNWYMELAKPVCFGYNHGKEGMHVNKCGAATVATMLHKGVHLTFCQHHLDLHNSHINWLRTKAR